MARSNVLSFQFTICLILLHFATATHVDEIIPLPTATVSPSNSIVSINSNQSFELNCTGTGTLRWYKGFDFDMPLDNQTQLLEDNVTLSLMVTLTDDESGAADERNRTYFCTASNSLGVARSYSVQIPFFQGFGEVSNTAVTVRLGQAVALFCNVTQRPVPTIVWYKNDTMIQPNTVDDPTPKYILLDDGQHLVIYNLVDDDVTATYKCGVINVVNPQNSNDNYTLNKVDTIPGDFIAYRPPIANQYVSRQDTAISYFYIAATNGDTEVAGTGSLSRTTQDEDLLRIRFRNAFVSTSGLNVILNEDALNVDTTTTVNYTIVEPLNVTDFPSVVDASSFHRFESESINFTCAADGTDAKLRWYFNGLPLANNDETLVLNNVSVANVGIYQCFWDGFFDHERESVSWALSVQIPIHPRNVVLSVSEGARLLPDFNRTLLPAGSPATLNISFVSDSLPTVAWMYTNNVTMEINFTNNTDYTAMGPILIDGNEDIYWISLTVNNVSADTSGFYYAVIDDSRTTPTETHRWFVSQHIPLSVPELSFGPFPCFLQSESSFVTCTAQSFPDPTIILRHDNDEVLGGDETFDPFTGFKNYTITIGNSMEDAGDYRCVATSNGVERPIDLTTQFCRKPTIESDSTLTGTMNQPITINCTVNSAPVASVTWRFNGAEIGPSNTRLALSTNGNVYQIRILSLQSSDAGNYTCFANNALIPANASATITLTVISVPEPQDDFPVLYVAVGAGGGVALLLILIIIIIACCVCCYISSKKKGNYNTRPHLTKDFTDGRGNVDQDSDEEDGGAEEPEAFQPQYESLPALRPAQPPQYKPSPAYNQGYGGEDIEMKKVPLPDFDDYPPQFYRQDNGGGGMMASSVPIGSQAGLQTRFEDFMSDDGQFV